MLYWCDVADLMLAILSLYDKAIEPFFTLSWADTKSAVAIHSAAVRIIQCVHFGALGARVWC